MVMAAAAGSDVARQHRRGIPRDGHAVRRHRRGRQHRRDLPNAGAGTPAEDVWARTLHVNVTSNYVLAEEAGRILKEQGLPAAIVLTSSANAIVPKAGSEPYDVSKAAINHLDSRARPRPRSARARERHRAGHRHRGVVDVSRRTA